MLFTRFFEVRNSKIIIWSFSFNFIEDQLLTKMLKSMEFLEFYEAGIVLSGQETKSIRQGGASIVDAFALIEKEELWIYELNIEKYKYSSDYDYFFRMIVKKKMQDIGTRKNEIFGIFRRGGYSSTIKFSDHFKEEIQIRLDNKQNKLLVLLIYIYKYIKNFKKI